MSVSTVASKRIVGLFTLLGALWGSSFVAIEVGLSFFPTLLFAGIRYAAAGVLVLGYAVHSTGRWLPRDRDELLSIAVVGVFVFAGNNAFIYLGQEHLSGAVAAIIVSLSPVLTAVFAAMLLPDSRLGPVQFLGVLVGLFGAATIANPDPNAVHSAGIVGVGLVFLGAASFALGSVLSRPLRTDLPAPSLQAWSMLVGAVVMLGAGFARGEMLAAVHWTPTAVGAIAYLVFGPGSLAFLLYFHLLDRVGPAQLNLVGYLEPVFATLLSWVALGHLVGPTTFLGFLAIFAGFALVKHEALVAVATGQVAANRSA